MGMSASQARLLSITARLTNNEYQSQMLTNSKLRLATETDKATNKYMNALDSQQLMYCNYDDTGAATKVQLTPALMYEYAPMKNQYSLINNSGKMLVSSLDAKNYNETNTLEDFLRCYGLVDDVTKEEHNPAYDAWVIHHYNWELSEPQAADFYTYIPGETTNELYDSFLWATAICYSSAMSYIANDLGLPGNTIYDSKGNKVLEYTASSWKVYQDDGSGNELSSSSYNLKTCYGHVLSHLLKLGNYTTITGQSITISDYDGSGSDSYKHWWQTQSSLNDRANRAAQLANIISESATPLLYCCAKNTLNPVCDITSGSSDVEKLMSDWYIDSSGNPQIKTLQQKVVDLNYAWENDLMTAQQSLDALEHFIKEDMTHLSPPTEIFLEDEYNQAHIDWVNSEPPMVSEVIESTSIVINDSEKGQWYTNLWYGMNGSDTANLVETSQNDDGEYIHTLSGMGSTNKDISKSNFDVFDDRLYTSAEWLQFALEEGILRINQATLTSPAENSGKLLTLDGSGITWNSIVYTNARDMVYVDNEKAIAIAEVEYTKTVKEIEAKDKKYDSDLKKLDTEHNALQTEYDSIKDVISKNVERSFKAFS